MKAIIIAACLLAACAPTHQQANPQPPKTAEYAAAEAQCTYEVGANQQIYRGGLLMQAAMQNHLFGLCMRAKGAY